MPCFLCMSLATELLIPQLAKPTVSCTCAHFENTCSQIRPFINGATQAAYKTMHSKLAAGLECYSNMLATGLAFADIVQQRLW